MSLESSCLSHLASTSKRDHLDNLKQDVGRLETMKGTVQAIDEHWQQGFGEVPC